MPVNTLLQVRRGSSSDWSTANGGNGTVLGAGEIGLDTTIDRIKIGDGTTAWNSLEFLSVGFDDLHTSSASGVSISKLTDSNSQVTGVSFSTNLAAGDNITLTESAGQITINSTGGVDTEGVQDVVGAFINATSGLSKRYDDAANTFDIGVVGITLDKVTDVTATASEVNLVDGSSAGTIVNSKAVIYGSAGEVNATTLQIGGTSITSDATEINTLDGVTGGTVSASKAVVVDSNKDLTGLRNLTIAGDLTVNGTTTTVNSTVVSVDDPVMRVGGDTVPGSDDNKDRGVEFLYHDGSVAKSGFFGYDDSTGKFTFIPDATNTSEVFGGTKGEIDATVDFSNLANIDITNTHINSSAAIDVNKLSASGITVGTTEIILGNSSTSLSGMAIFAGTNAGSPVVISYATIDGGSP